MKNHKALLLVLCAALLVSATAFGTLAYFTDYDQVTNTFTVGSIGLSLDEATVNEKGEVISTDRWVPTEQDPKQEYDLRPGHVYVKDPTATVDANSEAAYVRMIVTVTCEKEGAAVFEKYPLSQWVNIGSTWDMKAPEVTITGTQATLTYECRYKDIVAKNTSETKLPALFDRLTVPGEISNSEMIALDGMDIAVVAHAMQASGFGDADSAWTAFDGQFE